MALATSKAWCSHRCWWNADITTASARSMVKRQSLQRSALPQQRFPPRNVSPRGWCLPGRRRDRKRQLLQPPLSQRQPAYATLTQSSRKCRSQNQRKHLRDCVSPLGPAPGTQSSHWSHYPSTVSTDLADPPPRSPLRGTRPSSYQTIEAWVSGTSL
jgi:hypothetical protein